MLRLLAFPRLRRHRVLGGAVLVAGRAMSLLKKLERRDYTGGTLVNPFGPPNYQIPTNGQLAFVDGSIPVNADTAMRHWAVWSCVRLIADVISTLPIDVFKG